MICVIAEDSGQVSSSRDLTKDWPKLCRKIAFSVILPILEPAATLQALQLAGCPDGMGPPFVAALFAAPISIERNQPHGFKPPVDLRAALLLDGVWLVRNGPRRLMARLSQIRVSWPPYRTTTTNAPQFRGASYPVNQLIFKDLEWSRRADLNRRPADYESAALPLSYVGWWFHSGLKTVRGPYGVHS